MDPATAEAVGKWFDLCHRAGVSLAAASAMAETLVAAYQDDRRAYHSLEHVQACLRLVEHAPLGDDDRLAAELALWFHDLVYDTTRQDNEERSAAEAERWLEAQQFPGWALVGEAIRMTAGHAVHEDDHVVLRVLHDIDLAILGSAPDDYDAYVAGIRAEYGDLDDPTFRAGRRRVLEALLCRDPIYVLDSMQASLERQARANLERELAALDRPD